MKLSELISAFQKRLIHIVSTWQELIIWMPTALVVMLGVWYAIPHIDRDAGIDGWGALWGYLMVGVAVMIAAFLAWLITRTYHLEFDDDAERELIDYAAGIDRTPDGVAFGHGATNWKATVIWLGHRAFFLIVFIVVLGKLLP